MKRVLSIFLVLLLFAACSQPPASSQSSREVASGGGDLSADRPQKGPSEQLLSIAADFAENYPFAFASPEKLFPDHFTLFKIYDEDPTAVDENGILWVSPERLAQEVELRFGISDFQLQPPIWEDEYPRYVEEKGAIAFIPVGKAPWLKAELIAQSAEGEYYLYTFGLYDDVISDEHPEKTLERTLLYRFRVVETADGAPFLQAVSAEELSREGAPEEEQQNDYNKYLQPYHIVGLMYQTWSDPEEIDVSRYMQFYIYNESSNYFNTPAGAASAGNGYAIPADIVEGYITSYFEVAPAYLRTSEKYDPAANCYRSMQNEGIGGGPAPDIERIEKDGDRWKFICRNMSGNLLSVTIRMLDENSFHYVAGEVMEMSTGTDTAAADRVDEMYQYLKENLDPWYYAEIQGFHGGEGSNYIQVNTPFPDEVESVVQKYPGQAVPVICDGAAFSIGQLKQAEKDLDQFLADNPDVVIERWLEMPFFNGIWVETREENQKLRDFVESYSIRYIYDLRVSPDGSFEHPD